MVLTWLQKRKGEAGVPNYYYYYYFYIKRIVYHQLGSKSDEFTI